MRTKELMDLEGKNCKVKLKHKLYGEQTVEAPIHIINDGERLGFRTKNSEIFLWNNEITELNVNENECLIRGEMMQIRIRIK